MKLSIPLAAVVAARLATVAAIAVPLPWPAFRSLQPIRDSSPLERVPTTNSNDANADADLGLRRVNADDTGGIERISVLDTPGRRIGHGGLRREGVERNPVRDVVRDNKEPVRDVVRVVVVSTVTSTQFSTVTTTGTITPSLEPSVTPSASGNLSTTAAPSFSLSSTSSCDLRYCDNGTSWCEYWGGYSSFDVSAGRPIPGETRSSIGVCSTRASPGPVDSTTTSAYKSTSSGGSSSGGSAESSSEFSSSSIPSSSRSEDPLDSITCTLTIKSLASSGSSSSTSASSSSSSSSSSSASKSASKRA